MPNNIYNFFQWQRLFQALFAILLVLAIIFDLLPIAAAQADSIASGNVLLDVPHTSQAPLGEWRDPRQQDGCEEADVIMAMMWVWGTSIPPEEVRRDIINMAELEKAMWGFHEDSSAQDTASLFQTFFHYDKVTVKENIGVADIKAELAQGHLVIVPLNTRLLGVKSYRRGPVRHTIVVTGYDDSRGEVTINDPLTKNGKNIRLKQAALQKALWNYSSGRHKPLPNRQTALISVSR